MTEITLICIVFIFFLLMLSEAHYEEEVNHGMMFAGVPDEERHHEEVIHILGLSMFIFLLILILFI